MTDTDITAEEALELAKIFDRYNSAAYERRASAALRAYAAIKSAQQGCPKCNEPGPLPVYEKTWCRSCGHIWASAGPVLCHHEAFRGECAHCGVPIINGRAVYPKGPQS